MKKKSNVKGVVLSIVLSVLSAAQVVTLWCWFVGTYIRSDFLEWAIPVYMLACVVMTGFFAALAFMHAYLNKKRPFVVKPRKIK